MNGQEEVVEVEEQHIYLRYGHAYLYFSIGGTQITSSFFILILLPFIEYVYLAHVAQYSLPPH